LIGLIALIALIALVSGLLPLLRWLLPVVIQAALDALAFQLLDLLKLLAQVIHDAGGHVVAVELLVALVAHALQHLSQAHRAAAIFAAHALLHQAAHRLLQVAVFQVIIRKRIENIVGVQSFDSLRSIPTRIAVAIFLKAFEHGACILYRR
jgi:chromosome segregation and condensation protein ScpB